MGVFSSWTPFLESLSDSWQQWCVISFAKKIEVEDLIQGEGISVICEIYNQYFPIWRESSQIINLIVFAIKKLLILFGKFFEYKLHKNYI